MGVETVISPHLKIRKLRWSALIGLDYVEGGACDLGTKNGPQVVYLGLG